MAFPAMFRFTPLILICLLLFSQNVCGMEVLREIQEKKAQRTAGNAEPQTPPQGAVAASLEKTELKVPSGPPVVLVQEGTNPLPVIVFEGAPKFVQLAANELAATIEKMSGARPEVLEGLPDPIPDAAIWVGYQPEMAKLFPDLNFDFANPEEILIATRGKNIIIAGRDKWDPEHPTAPATGFQFGGRDVEGYQQEYGTVNAVYTFLQDQLGVRWLWAGEDGEVIPKSPTVVVNPLEFLYHPKIRQRHGIFGAKAIFRIGGDPSSPGSTWVRRNRLQLDSLYAPVGGHGFGDWWERFKDEHPEYFALQPDGTRGGFPAKVSNVKICETNPKVWDQWLADVEEIIQTNPHRTVFSAAANDSYASGHCVCEDCMAWDHPEVEKRKFVYSRGVRQMRPALSNRMLTFGNILAKKLKEKYPDKDYMVSLFAYGFTRPIPIGVRPDDNVIIAGVANVFADPDSVDTNSPDGTTHWQQLEGWQEISKNFIWRPNVGNPAAWQSGGPPDVNRMAKTFKTVASGNCIGINIDQIWYFWATQAPLFYAMARLGWDPSLDEQEVLREFYEKGFGPAAGEIQAYWNLLSEARNKVVAAENKWSVGFTPELFQECEKLLGEADKKTAGTEYAKRVEFVRAGFEFLELRTENTVLLAKARAEGLKDSPELTKAWENWKRIEEISEKYPLALNRPQIKKPQESRISGIYPGRILPDPPEKPAKAPAAPAAPAAPDGTPIPPNDLDLF